MPARALAVVFAAAGALWVAPSAARACSCTKPPPPERAAAHAARVFEGRASGPVPDGDQVRYTFEVTQSFKGGSEASVEVVTRANSAMCGRHFEAGTLYLVYATRAQGEYRDSLCSRTRPSSAAEEDFQVLRPTAPSPPSDEAVTVEPPRIESPSPQHPPAVTPASSSGRGCAVGAFGVAQAPGPSALMLSLLLGVARARRRP